MYVGNTYSYCYHTRYFFSISIYSCPTLSLVSLSLDTYTKNNLRSFQQLCLACIVVISVTEISFRFPCKIFLFPTSSRHLISFSKKLTLVLSIYSQSIPNNMVYALNDRKFKCLVMGMPLSSNAHDFNQ